MRFLIGAACVAVIAFVGYFFWGEYNKSQAIERAMQAAQQAKTEQRDNECDARVSDLNSWIGGNPTGQSKSFLEAREYVDQCLKLSAGTDWYNKNIHVKYW
jgi:predicted negative regulator of RcsB-dependent stress response